MKATTCPEGLLRRRLTLSRAKLGSRLRRRQRMKDKAKAGHKSFQRSGRNGTRRETKAGKNDEVCFGH